MKRYAIKDGKIVMTDSGEDMKLVKFERAKMDPVYINPKYVVTVDCGSSNSKCFITVGDNHTYEVIGSVEMVIKALVGKHKEIS
jgi:hypothetical protein